MPRIRKLNLALILATAITLLLGCAERGKHPPIIHAVGSTPPPPRPAETVLRLGTANLWGVSILSFDWAADIDERFAAMAERLSANPQALDVVLIQEAWKGSARQALLQAPGVVRNFPYRVDSLEEPGGAGLVVLSRFPIEAAHFHRFDAQGNCLKFWEGDCLSGKGVLLVRLRVHGRSLWIADTHLIACYAGDDAPETACDQRDPNGHARANQILETREMIETLVGDEPVLLGGDLNFTRTSRYYRMMTNPKIPHDPSNEKGSESETTPRRGWLEPGEASVVPNRLDYLWTRSGRELRWHPIQPVGPIFEEPVRLHSGKYVALSDHPILMGAFCLTRVDDAANHCLRLDGDLPAKR